jgi:hypothetical protein
LQFNNYLSLVTNLLTTTNRSNQNSLKFKLTYVTSATPQGQTSSFEFTLADIVGGSLPPLLFTYLDEDHVNFQLQKIETADGCLDAFQANATYGI